MISLNFDADGAFGENNLKMIICKITGKTHSCWLNQLNASMGNIKYTCNVSVKFSSNSGTVKIYVKGKNDFFGLNATKIIRFSIRKMIQKAWLKSYSKMMSKCWIRSAFPCNNDSNKIVTPGSWGKWNAWKKAWLFLFLHFQFVMTPGFFLTKTAVWNRRTKTPRHLCYCWRYVYCASNLRSLHWSCDLFSANLSDKCW